MIVLSGRIWELLMLLNYLKRNQKDLKSVLISILKIDIIKYFYSIDHHILLNYIKNDLDNDEYLLLKINKNRTFIVNAKHGVNFWGYKFKVIDKKTIIKIGRSGKNKIRSNLKKIKYLYNNNLIFFKEYFNRLENIKNSYKFNKDSTIFNIISWVIQ